MISHAERASGYARRVLMRAPSNRQKVANSGCARRARPTRASKNTRRSPCACASDSCVLSSSRLRFWGRLEAARVRRCVATRGSASPLETVRNEKCLGNASDTRRIRSPQTHAKRNELATIVFALANTRERKRTHDCAADLYLSSHDALAPQSRRSPFCFVPALADLAARRELRARGVRQPAGGSDDWLRKRSDG